MNTTPLIRTAQALFLFAAGALLAGCTSARQSTAGAEGPHGTFVQAKGHDISEAEYIVDPPDEITIQSPTIKELDKSKQVVRPDGKITLNLLGEVKVSGLTPAQINAMLREKLIKYYVNPDIKCEVIANSKFYNVVGLGINTAGRKAFTGNDSVIKAIAEAGFNERGWPQQVLISRPGKNGKKPETAVVDFTKVFEYGDLSQNYLLQEGDIVYVRTSPIAYFNFKFEQIVGPVTGAGGVVSTGQNVGGAGR